MDKIKNSNFPGIPIRISYFSSAGFSGVIWSTLLALLFSCQQKNVSVYCIGDSTMAFYDSSQLSEKYGGANYPLRGWAMELPGFFSDHVTIENMAVSGRSSKSFKSEGFWDKVKSQFQKGDFLIIQFGHNDEKEKDPNRYTRPNGEFKVNLRNYAREAMDAGVHPIIATSIARRKFDDHGILIDTHGDYISVAREVAKELKIPMVDLNLLTTEYIQDQGVEESKKLFLHIAPGTFRKLPDGLTDDTHLSQKGGHEVSRLFAEGLKNTRSSLKSYILNEYEPIPMN